MTYTIRPARPEDVCPAIDLALHVYMEYSAPQSTPEGIAHFLASCEDETMLEKYSSGQWHMHVALDRETIIGMVCEKRGTHISRLYVDPAYHRQGIAKALMDAIIAAMNTPRITLNSSLHALPFYTNYGFTPTGEECPHSKNITPMVYDTQRSCP